MKYKIIDNLTDMVIILTEILPQFQLEYMGARIYLVDMNSIDNATAGVLSENTGYGHQVILFESYIFSGPVERTLKRHAIPVRRITYRQNNIST